MPITQIPFQDPVAPPPPEKPQPEQLGLYDAETGRRRIAISMRVCRISHSIAGRSHPLASPRAAWISIITHLVIIIWW